MTEWDEDSALEDFHCSPGCNLCCQGILSVSIPELIIMTSVRSAGPEFTPQTEQGCPFRLMNGCQVYSSRPFMCRLFGFHFAHPEMLGQPFCPKVSRLRPGDEEAGLLKKYVEYCEENGFIFIGKPRDQNELERLLPENRKMVLRFPEIMQFQGIITGGQRCWETDE